MFDTIIFDMDGTLLNTLEDLRDAANAGLAAKGYPARSLEEVRQFVGNGVGSLLKKAVPEGTSEEDWKICLKAFKDYYGKHGKDKTTVYEGIPELLRRLRAAGKKTAVISNKYDEAVVQLCKDYFPGLFDVTRGERPGVPRKPAPDGIDSILKELGSDREHALYVGDSEVDMETAKNARLVSVGVTWGFRDRRILTEHGADYIIHSPAELLEIVK